jgi:AraC family transcriptional regulator of adaptative response / DNA-3-methyladenine glycosylase II
MARTQKPISGVVTTGIYCRAGCPGQPKRSNVQRYASPVAAEAAGFRPCLRCRPDRLPPSQPANGAPEPVQRALVLLGEGTLDEANEEDLARQVGLSGRQLRRLFLQHVGATPALVARSRRAHFARRLLDETDLSVTGITYAAGFSSVRQMNRVMAEVFRFKPTELRARRSQRDRLVTDGGLPLRTPYSKPFSFAAQLSFLEARAVQGIEGISNGTYRRTISTCGHPGMVEVSDAGDGAHLLIAAHLPTFNALIEDVARVRRIFGLDQPVADAIPQLATDPILGPMIDARPGLRLIGPWDRFETAVRIVLSQQISLRGARTILSRLVATFGEPVAGLGDGLTHLFPTAGRLARASESQIATLGMPAARAATIRHLARAYVSERLPLDGAALLDAFVDQVTALPGMGPWTAHCIALRAAGYLDAFPSEDLGLRRAYARATGMSAAVAPAQLHECAEGWRPYRGLAAMYLWASLLDDGTAQKDARDGLAPS